MADDTLILADRIKNLQREVDRLSLKIRALAGEDKEFVFVPEKYEIKSTKEAEMPTTVRVAE